MVHHSKLNIVVPAHACGNKLKVVIIMLNMYRPLYSIFNRTLKKKSVMLYTKSERQMCVYARTLMYADTLLASLA